MKDYAEDEKTELKRELTDEVKSEILAFLNGKGGTVFVGVEDDGTVIGFSDNKVKDEMDLKLGNWIQEAYFPKPSGLIEYSFNRDNVLEIKVSKGISKPYYLRDKGPKPSGVYIRVGRSKRKANEDEILRMIMETRRYSYEEDISDEQELTFRSFERVLEENDMNLTERMMNTFGMKTRDGEFTNLAFLLSDQSDIVVKLAEYDSELNFRLKKSFKGSLVRILDDVEEQTERLNDLRVIIDGSSFTRKETKSYPGAAIREIVLNAFCHANYFIRSNIKIEFFTDKVKVTSPGGIFNASMDDIMNGVQTYRNPRLVYILDKLGKIENYGKGIPRTIMSYQDYDVKPEFKASENFFIVTLPNVNYYQSKTSGIMIDRPITELGVLILKRLKETPGLSTVALTNILKEEIPSINRDRVKNEIKRNLGDYVEHIGSNRTGGYYLKKSFTDNTNEL